MSKLCGRCGGTGHYLGNGMTLIDCYCDDVKESKPVALDKIDRRSKSYRDAIKELMKINPELKFNEAEKLFNETYDKV